MGKSCSISTPPDLSLWPWDWTTGPLITRNPKRHHSAETEGKFSQLESSMDICFFYVRVLQGCIVYLLFCYYHQIRSHTALGENLWTVLRSRSISLKWEPSTVGKDFCSAKIHQYCEKIMEILFEFLWEEEKEEITKNIQCAEKQKNQNRTNMNLTTCSLICSLFLFKDFI